MCMIFSHLLSDCHNPIHVKLNMSLHEGIHNVNNASKVLQPEKVKRWSDDLQQNFIDNLVKTYFIQNYKQVT